MTPGWASTFLLRTSQQLPRLRLGSLMGLLSCHGALQGHIRLALCIASGTAEKHGHRQVCRARRRGPRTPSRTTDANLDCVFVENKLIYTDR